MYQPYKGGQEEDELKRSRDAQGREKWEDRWKKKYPAGRGENPERWKGRQESQEEEEDETKINFSTVATA